MKMPGGRGATSAGGGDLKVAATLRRRREAGGDPPSRARDVPSSAAADYGAASKLPSTSLRISRPYIGKGAASDGGSLCSAALQGGIRSVCAASTKMPA